MSTPRSLWERLKRLLVSNPRRYTCDYTIATCMDCWGYFNYEDGTDPVPYRCSQCQAKHDRQEFKVVYKVKCPDCYDQFDADEPDTRLCVECEDWRRRMHEAKQEADQRARLRQEQAEQIEAEEAQFKVDMAAFRDHLNTMKEEEKADEHEVKTECHQSPYKGAEGA